MRTPGHDMQNHNIYVLKCQTFVFKKTDIVEFEDLAINQYSAPNDSTEWFVVSPYTDGYGWL